MNLLLKGRRLSGTTASLDRNRLLIVEIQLMSQMLPVHVIRSGK